MKKLAMERYTGAFICTTVLVLLTVFGTPQAVAVDAVTDDTVAERISSAKTAADHEAIAAYFKAQGAAQAEKVKRHEAMLKSWEKIVSGKSLEHMRNHCQTLISTYRQPQRAFEGLAAEHEKLAKAAGAGH